MRRSLWITVITSTLSLGAAANDGVELRTKALASAGVSSSAVASNYVKPESTVFGRDPMSALVQMESPAGSSGPQAACANTGGSICYDATDGRIVYRGAREYMPKMNGFQAESLSIRHNAVIFKYTFH